ncbi:MAG: hypothetical protein OK455_04865, partial [Thaumarchaeota archaeon]|nr:hypothetical protein [Nitrososphaerota archaeon]
DALAVAPFLLIIASTLGLGWLAYRARLHDDRLDRFLTLAGTLAEERWLCLSALLASPRHAALGRDVAKATGKREGDTDVDESLTVLERMRLVRRVLSEKGGDLVMVWKACA